MDFESDNFLYAIKQTVTGINGDGDISPGGTGQAADGGIRVDIPFIPSDISNTGEFPAITDSTTGTASTTFGAIAGTTYATDAPAIKNALAQIAKQLNALALVYGSTDSGKIPTYIVASGTNATVGTISFLVPRDYDEASDHFFVRIPIYLANADASITITGTPSFQQIGGAASSGPAVTGRLPFGLTSANLSTTLQILEINLSGNGIKRDETVSVALALVGTTTGNTNILGYDISYDSTIVSYNESDTTGVDGSLQEEGNPLR